MSDQLRVDLQAIRDMSGQLHTMAQQLSDVFNYPAGDFSAEAGAADLAAALQEFAGNWTIRQQNLLSDLQDLGKVSESAVTAMTATDGDLAKALDGALTTAQTPPPPPPHYGGRYAE